MPTHFIGGETEAGTRRAQESNSRIRIRPGSAVAAYPAGLCLWRQASEHGPWGPGPRVQAHLPVAPASLCGMLLDAASAQWSPAGSARSCAAPSLQVGHWGMGSTWGSRRGQETEGKSLSSASPPHRDLDSFRERLPCSGVYSRGSWQRAGGRQSWLWRP